MGKQWEALELVTVRYAWEAMGSTGVGDFWAGNDHWGKLGRQALEATGGWI